MAKARAIIKRLKAVKNIRKITRTMELVATARFKKAMDRATEAAAYTRKIAEMVADLSRAGGGRTEGTAFSHPLLEKHDPVRNRVVLVLTSNRGLCGGYNSGVLRAALPMLRRGADAGETLRTEVSGKRGINFLKFQRLPMDATYTHFDASPTFAEVEVLADRLIAEYTQHKIDRLDVAYMQFVSASRQRPVVETLLPIGSLGDAPAAAAPAGPNVDYEFLPSPTEILKEIVPASFKARLFKCFLDAAVSEQIFRMVAMKGATENADDMISNIARQYNRARQSQITSELSEIIGGAAALE